MDGKVNATKALQAAATSYLRHFGDKTSMQHLKAQLIAEFGESVYRANEQMVMKLLAKAIQSWSTTKRLDHNSVAFAFFSCVDMKQCLDWASRLHGLHAQLKPFMHKIVDRVSPSKSRDTHCSAEVLAECVLRSIASARRQQQRDDDETQSSGPGYHPFPLVEQARVTDTTMTQRTADALLRQTLAHTLHCIRGQNATAPAAEPVPVAAPEPVVVESNEGEDKLFPPQVDGVDDSVGDDDPTLDPNAGDPSSNSVEGTAAPPPPPNYPPPDTDAGPETDPNADFFSKTGSEGTESITTVDFNPKGERKTGDKAEEDERGVEQVPLGLCSMVASFVPATATGEVKMIDADPNLNPNSNTGADEPKPNRSVAEDSDGSAVTTVSPAPKRSSKGNRGGKTSRKVTGKSGRRRKGSSRSDRKKKHGIRVGVLVRINTGNSAGLEGVVKFLGQTSFAKGKWIGIELTENRGKNDGSVHGAQYFECKAGHGVFVLWGTCSPVHQPKFKPKKKKKKLRKSLKSSTTKTGKKNKRKKRSSVSKRKRLVEGDVVGTERDGATVTGVVRFYGPTQFAPGTWVGIELPDPMGLNDGSVLGRRYFECPVKHGLFVPANKVTTV